MTALAGARLTFRLNRFELIAFGIALGGLAIAVFLASAYVAGLTPPVECLRPGDVLESAECQLARIEFSDAQGRFNGLLVAPLLLVTYTIGLFLGVPIVGRELERGTVRLAWWLSPSRLRWYAARVLPILAVLVVLTFAAGVAMDRWFAVSMPGQDVANSFDGYGARGGLLAGRAVLLFAVAVAAGAIIGRVLPAVILAAVIAGVGLWGGLMVEDRVLASEAVQVEVDPNDEFGGFRPGDRYIDQRFRLPDGSLVGYEYFGDNGPYDEFGNPTYPMVNLVIPGSQYRFVEAREALALGVVSVAFLLLAAAVVVRRRPG
jgi:hypothetical protein